MDELLRNNGFDPVPLTVQERSGVDVEKAIVSNGVPLPLGAIFDVSQLKIANEYGEDVQAGFWPLQRWQDGSLRFVMVNFLTNLTAYKKSTFHMLVGQGDQQCTPLNVYEDNCCYTVVTGPLKFVVRKNGFNVIDQLWLDCTGKQEFTDQNQVIECHDQGLAAIVDGRRYTSSRGRVDYTEIERQDPVSVVIKAAGTLGNGSDEKLYYKVWIKAWADSQEVEVSFNIAKKDGETLDHFYQIGSVSIDLPIRKGRDITYAFGGKFGAHEGKVKGSSSIYQKSSDSYELLINEKTVASVRSGKSDKCQNLGWADIRSAGKGIGVAYRWFWQNFPSAIIANEDGKISVQVWAKYHEPLKLYTGVAKTTDIRFYFHEDCESLADVGDRLKSFQLLTIAKAPASWYCQGTKAIDPHLVDLCLENYPEEEHEQIQLYLERFDRSFQKLLRDRDYHHYYAAGEDGYGFMNFGDGLQMSPKPPHETPETPGLTWWSNNYNDHPHCIYIHFFRTGKLEYLDYALQHEYHLMDIDTASCDPDNHIPGEYKTCPSVMHIKQYNRGYVNEEGRQDYVFGGQGGHWHFQSVEGLFDTYYITGNGQALDRGLESAEFAMQNATMNFDSQTRSIGHTLEGLAAAYRHTWDERYLKRMNWVWSLVQQHAVKDFTGVDNLIIHNPKYTPYVFVLNWPFQSGILIAGIYKYRQFSPDIKGNLGIDTISCNTLAWEIWGRLEGEGGHYDGWLEKEQRWVHESDILTSSGGWLHSLFPEKGFLDILRKAGLNNIQSDYAFCNKHVSQSFKYQWITHYEMALEEIRNELYCSFTAFPRTSRVGEPVVFNNQSTGMQCCFWDFGDGEGSDSCDVNVSHIYTKPGTYDVTLTVGKKDGIKKNLIIKDYIRIKE